VVEQQHTQHSALSEIGHTSIRVKRQSYKCQIVSHYAIVGLKFDLAALLQLWFNLRFRSKFKQTWQNDLQPLPNPKTTQRTRNHKAAGTSAAPYKSWYHTKIYWVRV